MSLLSIHRFHKASSTIRCLQARAKGPGGGAPGSASMDTSASFAMPNFARKAPRTCSSSGGGMRDGVPPPKNTVCSAGDPEGAGCHPLDSRGQDVIGQKKFTLKGRLIEFGLAQPDNAVAADSHNSLLIRPQC